VGHWYTHEGAPCHFQQDGKDTNLRHARKQNLVPSVTGVLDMLDKPGLLNYKINHILAAAWEAKDSPQVGSYAEFAQIARENAGEHSKQAREKGSAVHKALEDDANGEVPEAHHKIVDRVVTAIHNEFGDMEKSLVPEATFAHKSGYGGAVDLSCPKLILDYKYKIDGLKKKMVYEDHIRQLAAYRDGLGYKDALCGNVFISDDEVQIVMIPEKDLIWGRENFQLMLALWKHTKKFECGFS